MKAYQRILHLIEEIRKDEIAASLKGERTKTLSRQTKTHLNELKKLITPAKKELSQKNTVKKTLYTFTQHQGVLFPIEELIPA